MNIKQSQTLRNSLNYKDVVSLGESFKNKYHCYVRHLPIDKFYQDLLVENNFIEQNPTFYLYYPKLFSSVFDVKADVLDKLCIAGYLYYISILQIDRLVDDNETSSLMLISIAQEESIKILTNIFGLKSEFWSFWNLRRSEYYRAIVEEKRLMKKSNVSFDTYKKLSDLKSAYGKVAIDALHLLSQKRYDQEYNKLLESHLFFSTAFQINDDILDFIEDIEKGQFNWAVHLMSKSKESLEDAKRAKKIFYLEDYGNRLFKLAINCLDNALLKIEGINLPHWEHELRELKMKFQSSIIETENYIEILKINISNSKVYFKNNTIEKAKTSAIDFISKKQLSNGSWREYKNQGGISNIWATAFILSKLSDFEEEINIINYDKALKFLKDKEVDNKWGYNETWLQDGDTTAFSLSALFLNKVKLPREAIEAWMTFKKEGEGFSTYNDEEFLLKSLADRKITNVYGWVVSHQCVSAASLYLSVLLKHDELTSDLIKYFDNLISLDEINSYWWSSPIYTLHFLAKSYYLLNEKNDKIKFILKKILSFQGDTGCFHDPYGENLFFTGLALEALCIDYSTYKKEIEHGIDFILQNQFDDGSWKNSNSLQVPSPSDVTPLNKYPAANFGTSVRAKEFNRLFTTVSNLSALITYEKRRINS